MINKLDDILSEVKGNKKVVLSVSAAHDKEVLLSIKEAVQREIVTPILIGDKNKIEQISAEIKFNLDNIRIIQKDTMEECAKTAIQLVSSKEADFVMKGLLDTSIILNKEYGLRTDSLLSHVMIYEIPAYKKLLITTDGGMNISPDYNQKVNILKNAIEATKPLGLENIKVACLAAKEKVNSKMQATLDARALQEAAQVGVFGENVIVEGPLAFDLAVSKEAANIKGFKSKVAGETDIMLMPTIEVGNGIGKALTYFAKAKSAGIIMGAKAPIVLVSRADSHESKLYSIAYGALVAKYNK